MRPQRPGAPPPSPAGSPATLWPHVSSAAAARSAAPTAPHRPTSPPHRPHHRDTRIQRPRRASCETSVAPDFSRGGGDHLESNPRRFSGATTRATHNPIPRPGLRLPHTTLHPDACTMDPGNAAITRNGSLARAGGSSDEAGTTTSGPTEIVTRPSLVIARSTSDWRRPSCDGSKGNRIEIRRTSIQGRTALARRDPDSPGDDPGEDETRGSRDDR